MGSFGAYTRKQREQLLQTDRSYSLRQVAARVGIKPAYLSKIECEIFPPPSEEVIRKLARELEQDEDAMLAMAGKVSTELLEVIIKRPTLMADLIRQVKDMPDDAILKVVRVVRDGDW